MNLLDEDVEGTSRRRPRPIATGNSLVRLSKCSGDAGMTVRYDAKR